MPLLWSDCKSIIPGLQWSYAYLGTPGSYFAPHVEDMDLPSVNFHLLGDPKLWLGFCLLLIVVISLTYYNFGVVLLGEGCEFTTTLGLHAT